MTEAELERRILETWEAYRDADEARRAALQEYHLAFDALLLFKRDNRRRFPWSRTPR